MRDSGAGDCRRRCEPHTACPVLCVGLLVCSVAVVDVHPRREGADRAGPDGQEQEGQAGEGEQQGG